MNKYLKIRHRSMTFEEHCLCFPTEKIRGTKNIKVSKHYIPYDYETTKIVFFVDGTNGDSYGQYPTEKEALERYEYLKTLSLEDLKREDQ